MPMLKRWLKRSVTRWGPRHECLKRNFYSIGSVNGTLGDRLSAVISGRLIWNNLKSKMNSRGQIPRDLSVARHRRCDVYCGARETVGESSVSSGCWGEDSNHENEWARHTPTLSRPFAFVGGASSHKTCISPFFFPSDNTALIQGMCQTILSHLV